jgi:hypothetical protein
MLNRPSLTVNNRRGVPLFRHLASGADNVRRNQGNQQASMFSYARNHSYGRQNSEGFGGGRIVGR